jgi:N-methylhydantoinase A
MFWLGVDVGGTFTDLVLINRETGEIKILKTPSTTANQSEGILNGVQRIGVDAAQLERFVHGTTVATNTALERNGARLAVLVTEGHKDVLVVGRGGRTAIYNIKAPPLVPLVERSQCFEVRERIRADGAVVTRLDESQLARIAEQLKAANVETVAICFLHSYINPVHELRCAKLLARMLPGVDVTASVQVLPEFREYERFSTTAVNAYVAPRMRRYIGDLRSKLSNAGLRSTPTIMTSNGGSLPANRVEDMPVLTMLSGPAAGVIAASHIGRLAGCPNVITCDMGGTSTDVCLIQGGEFGMTTDGRVGAFPIKIRQIDIHSVAVGGGSIASYGSSGFLSVGPRSAGSTPGPACYGRGGTEPTITDANVVLGRLGVDQRLGGEIKLDRSLAQKAVTSLADKVGLDANATAEGILRIATVSLASAIKEVSIMRGIDPRDFALLPYGGAGALHAVGIADELGMRSIVVPPLPGNFSALGLLLADVRRDYVLTRISPAATTPASDIRAMFDELIVRGRAELEQTGFAAERCRFAATLDMRYAGQSFELAVPVASDIDDTTALLTAFGEIYAARYGSTTPAVIEIVSYRVAAWGLTEKPELPRINAEGRSLQTARIGTREVFIDGKAVALDILDRGTLPLESAIAGPVLIEESGTSTFIPQGWSAILDLFGCILLSRI